MDAIEYLVSVSAQPYLWPMNVLNLEKKVKSFI